MLEEGLLKLGEWPRPLIEMDMDGDASPRQDAFREDEGDPFMLTLSGRPKTALPECEYLRRAQHKEGHKKVTLRRTLCGCGHGGGSIRETGSVGADKPRRSSLGQTLVAGFRVETCYQRTDPILQLPRSRS